MEETEVSKHEGRIAVNSIMRKKKQVKEGPLKEPLLATGSATELEQIPKEKKKKKNHRRKTVGATTRVEREALKKFPGGDKY